MKILSAMLIIGCFAMASIAQESKSDSIKTVNKAVVRKTGADTVKRDTIKPSSKFSIQLTFARTDLGLARLIDNGSFTLSPDNQYLETKTWNSSNVGFEFFQMGYRFNHNFKIYVGGGIDWTHLRLKKNITILPDKDTLQYQEESINFEKNRFSSTYLRLPLSFQLRTNDDQKGNKIYFVFGPEIGFLINGKVKQVSNEQGKEKVKDDFNLNPFRYGAFARLGYDDLGLFFKYYGSDVFAEGQGPSGLKSLSFGIMVAF